MAQTHRTRLYCWGAYVRRAVIPVPFFPSSGLTEGTGEASGVGIIEHRGNAHKANAAAAAITRLHRERYGRGATTTRVVYQRNFLTVYLEDIYTPAERTLIEAGRQEAVKATRQEFQMAMRVPFTTAVEEATGRKVIAFMSQVHFDPDIAAEIFVLEPAASEMDGQLGDLSPAS